MFKKVTLIVWIFLHILLGSYSQVRDSFEITGQIGDLIEGEKVILSYYPHSVVSQPGLLIPLDSTYSKNGTFYFKGVVPNGPRFYSIRFEPGPWIHQFRWIGLLIDNNQSIIVKSNSLAKINHGILDQHVLIEGSPSNDAWLKFWPVMTMYIQNLNRVKNYILGVRDSLGFNKSMIEGLMMAKEGINTSLFNSFMSDLPEEFKPAVLPAVGRFELLEKTNYNRFWIKFYEKLDTTLRATHYGKKLRSDLSLCVGEYLPQSGLQIADNSGLSLRKTLAKNKVTLIRFVNTNTTNSNNLDNDLTGLLKIYRNKGLGFISVSSDTSNKAFYQLCNESNQQFKVVLVDSDARIILWPNSSAELQVYIEKTLNQSNTIYK